MTDKKRELEKYINIYLDDVSESTFKDVEFALLCIEESSGNNLSNVYNVFNEDIRKNKDFVKESIEMISNSTNKNKYLLNFYNNLHPDIKKDIDIIKQVINKSNFKQLEILNNSLDLNDLLNEEVRKEIQNRVNDIEFIKKSLEKTDTEQEVIKLYKMLSEENQKNIDIINIFSEYGGSNFYLNIHPERQKDQEVYSQFLDKKISLEVYKILPNVAKSQPDIVENLIKKTPLYQIPDVYKEMPESLKENADICIKLLDRLKTSKPYEPFYIHEAKELIEQFSPNIITEVYKKFKEPIIVFSMNESLKKDEEFIINLLKYQDNEVKFSDTLRNLDDEILEKIRPETKKMFDDLRKKLDNELE